MRGHLNRENREVLLVSTLMPRLWVTASVERSENVSGGKSDMNANRNSGESIVPSKKANNDEAEHSAADSSAKTYQNNPQSARLFLILKSLRFRF